MGAGKIARRSLLIGSAVVGGGIAFGVYSAKTPFRNPNLDTLAKGEASFNPWVIVDGDKVTLIAPHADKGQGVFSMQSLLIAEELDLDLQADDVEVSFGLPDKAYYNSGFAEPMANSIGGFMALDESQGAEMTRGFIGGVLKLAMPMMMTGGSSSAPDTFVKLREAGAVARETLKAAAAKKYGLAVDQLKTENGAVILPDGMPVRYTQLAEDAAKIKPVTKVELRDESQWRLIGKSNQRLDMRSKIDGTMRYGIDIEMPGMMYAAVRTNPRQFGELKGYDSTKARAMRGVHKIVQVQGGVAVIADNTWRAIQAVNAIECEWGEASYPAQQADHWKAIEDSFVDASLNQNARDEGDAGGVVAASDAVVEAEYRSPYVAHAPLEPLNATVLVTNDRADMWTGHQVQLQAEQFVADVTGHNVKNVSLHNQFMGGSFGHRLEFEFVKQAAEIANQMRGTPIKLTFSREEDFAHDFPRHITMGRGKGTVANGQVESMDLQIGAPSIMGSQMARMGMSMPGPDAQLHEGAWENPYFDLPNLRVRSYKAQDLAPVSSWRSVGSAPNGFIFDGFMDELIHAAGADPLEERLRLMGEPVSRGVLEAVGEMSSWGSPLGPNKGRGVAFVLSFGVPTAEVVEVTSTPRGIRIDKVWVAADVGKVIDPVNFENQVQGGVVFGLGHAINAEITYSDGMAEQSNFHMHEGMRLYQTPEIFVRGLEKNPKVRGIGEPPVPPAAPALANAIFAATGQRLREMPFNKHIDFV